MTNWTDRLSGEQFEAESLTDAIAYLRDALTEGETVAFDLFRGDTGESCRGEITGS